MTETIKEMINLAIENVKLNGGTITVKEYDNQYEIKLKNNEVVITIY